MTATIPFVKETFAKFNTLCFEGALPPITIKLTKARTFLGKVTYVRRRSILWNGPKYENYTMRISTLFDLPPNGLEDVVIHEMIHYYIALNGIKDSSAHGPVFRKMMEEINTKFNRKICIRHDAAKPETQGREMEIRPNWLCVTELQDGGWGITSCARTRIFDLYRNLPKCFRLKSMTWYGSLDPFFNRYPRSIKPRIYKISKEELSEHLSDATLLKCDGHSIYPV